MEKSLIDQYRAEFEKLKRQVEFLRILLRESKMLEAGIDISEIDSLRRQLLKAFKKKKISNFHRGKNACHCCYYTYAPNSSPLRDYDIAYLLLKNSNFQLPELSWPVTNPARHHQCKCLFLGPQGCLYGENRPTVCLDHICQGAAKAILGQSDELPKSPSDYDPYDDDDENNYNCYAGRYIRNRVLQKIDFPTDFMAGVAVSDWFFKILSPKIKNSKFARSLKKVWDNRQWPDFFISEKVKKFFPGFTEKEILEELKEAQCYLF